MTKETREQAAERIVRQEVLCCMSHLVHTLAQGVSIASPGIHQAESASRGLIELTEQAFDLASPVPDYEEAAREAGAKLHRREDDEYGQNWVVLDQNGNSLWNRSFTSEAGAAQAYCEEHNIEPYDREVYEHWAVSDWLADKLIEQGEKVDKDFGNLCIWARTCTGQGIAMDSVIENIARQIVEA